MNERIFRSFIMGQLHSATATITAAVDLCTGPDDLDTAVVLEGLTRALHDHAALQLADLCATPPPPPDPPEILPQMLN